MATDYTYVDSPHLLKILAADLKKSTYLAIDTEYDSFRYFIEKLCLIQIMTPFGVYLLDPIILGDLSPLNEVMSSTKVTKIFHAADNDIRLLKRDYQFDIKNIFDTQLACKLLHTERLDLGSVIKHYTGEEVAKNKRVQRSRWDRRPLSEKQVAYAVADIRFLPALFERLSDLLVKEGLLKEAEFLFDKLTRVEWKRKRFNPYEYRKFERNGKLSSSEMDKLKKLLRWRFDMGKRCNRACFMILSDDMIQKLIKFKFKNLDHFKQSKILSKSLLIKHGRSIYSLLS